MRRFRLRAGLMAALLMFGCVGGGVGYAAVPTDAPASSPVTPSVVEQSLDPGESLTVSKQVQTPAVPPRPDVVLLVDNTGSMDVPITEVKQNLPLIVERVFSVQPDSRFAVASYGDEDDNDRLFRLHQAFTDKREDIQNGVNELDAGGGGDIPEDWGNALWQLATGADGRNPFRPGASPIVVLVGDASSHDPSNGHSFDDVVTTLKANNVTVLAVDVESYSDGLDGQRDNYKKGQATRVTQATGGTYLEGIEPTKVADAIVSGLTNLPVTVTHRPRDCDPSLNVSLTPDSRQVTSGQTATFTETVTVAHDAPQGTTLACTVQFYLGPADADPAYQQHIRITVNDVTAPTVQVEDRTVDATGPDGTVIDYQATAHDAIDGDLPTTCDPPSGSRFPIGKTTVTCTATDKAGNTGTGTAVFTVVDETAPVVTVEDRTAEATGPDGAVISYPATAKDTVDGDVPVSCQPPSGSTFPLGKTTVTCTATDKAGNTGTATVVFTVVDTTPPVVTVDDRTAEATGPDGAVIDYPATAEDTVDGSLSLTCTPLSGSTFPVGKTTVTCTATDSSGNTGTDTAVFTVTDTGAPVVQVDDRSVTTINADGETIDYTATAEDSVDGDVPVSCTPRSGTRFPVGRTTVTCTAKDKEGNVGRDTAVFTVALVPPVPRPPAADLAVTADADPLPAFTGGTITTTFTLTNAGPDTAKNVVLAVTVPKPVSVLSAQSRCTKAKPCTLRAGDRIKVTARISYQKVTSGTLRARVTGVPDDPRTSNNTDTLRIRVLQPVLTVTPKVAKLGDVVLAEGRDFPAGTLVRLRWSKGITAAAAPVRVKANGTFRAHVLVLRKDRTGPRRLRADGPGYDRVDTRILVVPRSLQPPNFSGRG